MSQFALDFHPRAEQIKSAYEQAEEVVENWGDLALSFLRGYAMQHQRVFGEDVTKAAEKWGLVAPTDKRAWGGVYIRAQHLAILQDDGKTRRRNNGSKAADYRSLLYRGVP